MEDKERRLKKIRAPQNKNKKMRVQRNLMMGEIWRLQPKGIENHLEVRILGRAGRATSKRLKNFYKKKYNTREMTCVDLDEYKDF